MSENDRFATAEARPVVFIDRDDTLIEDPGYISDPAQVTLISGAAKAVGRLRKAGYPVVVVTNQSGIARGMFTEVELVHIHQRMQDLLRAKGSEVDAIYYCPYLDGPDAKVSAYRRDSDLRKPKPGMLLLAAREMNIDLAASWMVGDSMRDVQAGRSAGCRTVLIGSPEMINGDPPPDYVVSSLGTAADLILGVANGADVVRPCAAEPMVEDDENQQPQAESSAEAVDEMASPEGAAYDAESEVAPPQSGDWSGEGDTTVAAEAEQAYETDELVAVGGEMGAEAVASEVTIAPEDPQPDHSEPVDDDAGVDDGDSRPTAEGSRQDAEASWSGADGQADSTGSTGMRGGMADSRASGSACAVAVAPATAVACGQATTAPRQVEQTRVVTPSDEAAASRETASEAGAVAHQADTHTEDVSPAPAGDAAEPVLEEVVLTSWECGPSGEQTGADGGETPVKQDASKHAAPVARQAPVRDHRLMSSIRQELDKTPRDVSERIESLLEQLLEETRMVRRSRQHEDFSIGRLAGAIAQAVALCAIGGALYAAMEQTPESAGQVMFRLLAGIAFQLMALTWFVASKEK